MTIPVCRDIANSGFSEKEDFETRNHERGFNMKTMLGFGDSVLKGVLYENDHYRVTDASFYRRCEEALYNKLA